jgi:hypothetical protein
MLWGIRSLHLRQEEAFFFFFLVCVCTVLQAKPKDLSILGKCSTPKPSEKIKSFVRVLLSYPGLFLTFDPPASASQVGEIISAPLHVAFNPTSGGLWKAKSLFSGHRVNSELRAQYCP